MARRRLITVFGYITGTAIIGALFTLLLGSSVAADRNGAIFITIAIPAGLTWLVLRVIERRTRRKAQPD